MFATSIDTTLLEMFHDGDELCPLSILSDGDIVLSPLFFLDRFISRLLSASHGHIHQPLRKGTKHDRLLRGIVHSKCWRRLSVAGSSLLLGAS